MRFEWVKAIAFGPLVNRELRFSEGLNLVCGPNEAGKSSWHAALYAALCGRRRARGRPGPDQRFAERFRPWSGNEWRVSAQICLADGRVIELSHDLDGRVDRQAVQHPVGRDVAHEIINDGAPDGALWLGLDRQSFQAVACVRQAEITKIRDEAGALQGHLQSAAASVAARSTAAEALKRIDDFQSERVGSNRAPTRPLMAARRSLERRQEDLRRAEQAQAEFARLQREVELRRREVATHENARHCAEAKLAELRASEMEARAARAAELAARFPDGEPRDLEDDSLLSEQVVTALRDWDQRPQDEALQGLDIATLERRLQALPDPGPGDFEEDDEVKAAERSLVDARRSLDGHRLARPEEAAVPSRPPTAGRTPLLLVGVAAAALGIVLLVAGLVLVGALVGLAGAGLAGYALLSRDEETRSDRATAGGLRDWERAEAELLQAVDRAEAVLSAALKARGVEVGSGEEPSQAYIRYRDACAARRQRADIERQRAALSRVQTAEQGLYAAAARAGVDGTDAAAVASLLRGWQARRQERLRALDEAREAWTEYRTLLGGLTLEDLRTEAGRKREVANTLMAALDPSALDAVVLEDDAEAQMASLRQKESEAREELARSVQRLQDHARDMPDVVAAAEELEVAQAELARLEDLDRILERTRAFLERATERAHLAIAPALQSTLRRWLPVVTHGRYVDALVDPDSLEVKVRSEGGTWRAAESLSHGTAEQVYLLLRVALAQYLAKPGEPCPLILDDVTAQSDAERTLAILEALAELSAERQVIFFSQEAEVL
ncbi:MAG TPA: AAA family ATPase, partial [Dehalococcoidia bacterium]|nr:AAA family ATPase [Dehalococcoidia bacterium]